MLPSQNCAAKPRRSARSSRSSRESSTARRSAHPPSAVSDAWPADRIGLPIYGPRFWDSDSDCRGRTEPYYASFCAPLLPPVSEAARSLAPDVGSHLKSGPIAAARMQLPALTPRRDGSAQRRRDHRQGGQPRGGPGTTLTRAAESLYDRCRRASPITAGKSICADGPVRMWSPTTKPGVWKMRRTPPSKSSCGCSSIRAASARNQRPGSTASLSTSAMTTTGERNVPPPSSPASRRTRGRTRKEF